MITRKGKNFNETGLTDYEKVTEAEFYNRVRQSISKLIPAEKELPIQTKTEELLKDVTTYLKKRMPITINQTDHFYITK